MKILLSKFAEEQVKKIKAGRPELAKFKVGDSISVKYKITEGGNTRIQAFNGIVIAKTKSDSNYNSTFTVRKISSGVGVERKFMTYSPLVAGVDILKRGIVRRAKLYYLRNLTGKASRIKEKLDFFVQAGVVDGEAAKNAET
jgi:large subunit ribosomal protein L19